jgi:hypothetical protein
MREHIADRHELSLGQQLSFPQSSGTAALTMTRLGPQSHN